MNDRIRILRLTPFFIMSLIPGIQATKPYGKRQQEIWRAECDLGIISDPDCPVDGSWSPWVAWSRCQGDCDDIGHKVRTRECNNPPPSKDGLPCYGPEQEIVTCHLTHCTAEDFQILAQGNSAKTEALRQLETVPALMEHCLQNECPYEAIEAALYYDNTWKLNPEALWNALQCIKHDIGCPVNGEWGSWGKWSSCGAKCGRGVRWRLRRCDTPAPSDANRVCTGVPLQAKDCEGDQCAIEEHIDYETGGSWSEWEPWTECSEKCGPGVRRRRRVCNEKQAQHVSGTWGTHCQGQYDQLEICENKNCALDGGWSGWSPWGPCSHTCNAGRRSRTRSCTRPTPSGPGQPCVGPTSEVSSCHSAPCEVFSHTVAVLNGESFLHYNFEKKRSTLFHFYIRFLPLSPHGTLVRRGTLRNPNVRLSLQKWHVCLDAGGLSKSCALPRMCSPSAIEPAVWHSALVTVTTDSANLRLDDEHVSIRSTFPCDPELADDTMNILIGEKFRGEIQEVILNFIPLSMINDVTHRKVHNSFVPTAVSNIVYEKSGLEEAYLPLDAEQYLRMPCFDEQNEWKLKLTIKPKRDSGTILFLSDENVNSWLHVALQNMRVKLKLVTGELRTESSSVSEYSPDQWLDIVLSKKRDAVSIGLSINADERLHAVIGDSTRNKRRTSKPFNPFRQKKTCSADVQYNEDVDYAFLSHKGNAINPASFAVCTDEFFVGGMPYNLGKVVGEGEIPPFSGDVASITVNGVVIELLKLSLERYRGDTIQLSSRSASVSGSYHEITWGKTNFLNLICLHARTPQLPNTAHWLFLDTGIESDVPSKSIRSTDNGKVLRLSATANNDLRGFYTCRSHVRKLTRNIVTYGVIGKIQNRITAPDTATAVALLTTMSLVIGTLVWLIIEGIHDLRNGFGFFRDCHLSPQEEAEAVCQFIDKNVHLIGAKKAAIAKARARRKGRLGCRSSFSDEELKGVSEHTRDSESTFSEPVLPCLPAIKSSSMEQTHDVFLCEPCYLSSPRHGSNITSPRPNLTSSSSHPSPRPYFRTLTRHLHSSRDSLVSRKSKNSPKKRVSKLLTIKSSTLLNLSPAQRILQRFQQLKSDD